MKYFLFFILFLSVPLFASPQKGEPLPLVEIDEWKSDSFRGKVNVIFYVDPDERSDNENLEVLLHEQNFLKDKLQSIAIINMAATWLPNSLINSVLEGKKKKFANTLYVNDLKKELVDKWKLKDNSYDVLILDKKGIVVFHQSGKLKKEEMKNVVELIKEKIKE